MFKKLVLASIICSTVAHAQQWQHHVSKNSLPEIGVVASDAITLDKELVIGDTVMRQMRGQAPVIDDPVLNEYLQDLGNKLVIEAENVKFPFEFFILNNKEINAFAFFGGHVGVHTGLIVNANNEAELASVLSHEISHVTQRHIARAIQSQQRSSPLQLASMLGGILVAMANPEAGMAALSVGQAAAQQSSINYTRDNEKEADRVGLKVLSQAGYDPDAMASFFGKLAETYRFYSKPPAFLLTHPLPESRIADMRSRADSLPRGWKTDSLSFQLAKARIQARYFSNAKDNVLLFRDHLNKNPMLFNAPAQYGLALSLMGTENYQEANTIVTSLLKSDPNNLFYIDAATDIDLALKQYDSATARLRAQLLHSPRNKVLSLNLGNALITAGKNSEAVTVLKDYLLTHPDDLLGYQLMAEAYKQDKNFLEMHQSKAEVYALVSAYPRAIDELQTAYNFAQDSKLEKQRIRARIDQLRDAQDRLRSL